MISETTNFDDEVIGAMEQQFEPAPPIGEELTMLDLLGVEVPAPESTDMPLAPTATAFTDNKTKQGDGF